MRIERDIKATGMKCFIGLRYTHGSQLAINILVIRLHSAYIIPTVCTAFSSILDWERKQHLVSNSHLANTGHWWLTACWTIVLDDDC